MNNILILIGAVIFLAACTKKIPVLSPSAGTPVSQVVVGAGQSNMWYMDLRTQFASHCAVPVQTVNIAVPGTALSEWERGGQYNDRLISTLKQYQPHVMLWYQGEQDAALGLTSDYGDRFVRFLTHVRTDSGLGGLKIIFAQLGAANYPPSNTGWDEIKAQQAAIHLPGIYMIVTDDIPQNPPPDATHYTQTNGYAEIGRRFAIEFNDIE